MDPLTILKLGGSVITEKGSPLTPNHNAIRRIAREIAEAGVEKLIVVHGGGSFGHYMARKFRAGVNKLKAGGFSRIHQAMATLNRLVVNALVSAGLPAIEVQPSALVVAEGGEIAKFHLDTLKRMLDLKLVPVLYGDVVPDLKEGVSLISGDKIVSHLAAQLGASRVVVCVDVDGVYTRDPNERADAELIQEFSVGRAKAELGPSSKIDVTGGMANKVRELAKIVGGAEVLIVSGLKEGRVKSALLGEGVLGTRLVS